jgi:anthranilate synthase/phosphoribosyltransferase
MILVIDNYDSFTYNLVQYFQELGQEVLVRRNNKITLDEIKTLNPRAIVVSPGPGGPEDAGISLQVIRELGAVVPILGVCLGHQAIGHVFGGRVVKAARLMHGKTSPIFTNGDGLFAGMDKPFNACRYHSLIVDHEGLPDCLEITALTDANEIMGLRHKTLPVYGVQFHPESILTDQGKQVLINFLEQVEAFHSGKKTQSKKAVKSTFKTTNGGEPMLKDLIKKAISGDNLTRAEMENAMDQIMSGQATGAQIGAFLTALKMKGETVDEITGAAHVMRRKASPVILEDDGTPVIDTCGTGGDGAGTFNISTTVAFILAGAGVRVAKHGNRSVSSSCGSADVLRELGADLSLSPEDVGRCIKETGFGFLFAPTFHSAMKYAAGPRQELGVRTIFNLLGPLTNPAGASCQLVGVYDPDLTEPIAKALYGLGMRSAMVVHGLDGLDEISLCAPTRVTRVNGDQIVTTELNAEHLGLRNCEKQAISGGSADENAVYLRQVLDGLPGPRRDISLLNAAAALIVANKADDFTQGLTLAAEAVDSGAARQKLTAFLEFRA